MWDQAVVVLCMVHLVAADQFFQQDSRWYNTSTPAASSTPSTVVLPSSSTPCPSTSIDEPAAASSSSSELSSIPAAPLPTSDNPIYTPPVVVPTDITVIVSPSQDNSPTPTPPSNSISVFSSDSSFVSSTQSSLPLYGESSYVSPSSTLSIPSSPSFASSPSFWSGVIYPTPVSNSNYTTFLATTPSPQATIDIEVPSNLASAIESALESIIQSLLDPEPTPSPIMSSGSISSTTYLVTSAWNATLNPGTEAIGPTGSAAASSPTVAPDYLITPIPVPTSGLPSDGISIPSTQDSLITTVDASSTEQTNQPSSPAPSTSLLTSGGASTTPESTQLTTTPSSSTIQASETPSSLSTTTSTSPSPVVIFPPTPTTQATSSSSSTSEASSSNNNGNAPLPPKTVAGLAAGCGTAAVLALLVGGFLARRYYVKRKALIEAQRPYPEVAYLYDPPIPSAFGAAGYGSSCDSPSPNAMVIGRPNSRNDNDGAEAGRTGGASPGLGVTFINEDTRENQTLLAPHSSPNLVPAHAPPGRLSTTRYTPLPSASAEEIRPFLLDPPGRSYTPHTTARLTAARSAANSNEAGASLGDLGEMRGLWETVDLEHGNNDRGATTQQQQQHHQQKDQNSAASSLKSHRSSELEFADPRLIGRNF